MQKYNIPSKTQRNHILTTEDLKKRLEYFGNVTIYCGDKKVNFIKIK